MVINKKNKKIMKKQLLFIVAAAALVLTACDKDDETKNSSDMALSKATGVFTCDVSKELLSVADVSIVTPLGKEVKLTESNHSVSLTEDYTTFPFTGKIVLKQALRSDVMPDADKDYNVGYSWTAKITSLDKDGGIINFGEKSDDEESIVKGANLKDYFAENGEEVLLTFTVDKNGNIK